MSCSLRFNFLYMLDWTFRYKSTTDIIVEVPARYETFSYKTTMKQSAADVAANHQPLTTWHNVSINPSVIHKSTPKSKLSVMLANFHSIFDKPDNLKVLMYTYNADIVLGTEKWLSPDTENSKLNLPAELAIFRQDRAASWGVGVIIGIEKRFCPAALVCVSPFEMVRVTAHLAHVTCVIGVCYQLPGSSPEFVELLNDSLQNILNKYPNAVVFLNGDFNCPGIDWSASSVSCTSLAKKAWILYT